MSEEAQFVFALPVEAEACDCATQMRRLGWRGMTWHSIIGVTAYAQIPALQYHMTIDQCVFLGVRCAIYEMLIWSYQSEVPKPASFGHVRKSGVARALQLLSKVQLQYLPGLTTTCTPENWEALGCGDISACIN